MPTPQNDQTHSNNSSAFADELCVIDHFVWLVLKGLRLPCIGPNDNFKGTVMQIEKALTNDCLRVSKVS